MPLALKSNGTRLAPRVELDREEREPQGGWRMSIHMHIRGEQ
jgi:hypothetical protein